MEKSTLGLGRPEEIDISHLFTQKLFIKSLLVLDIRDINLTFIGC